MYGIVLYIFFSNNKAKIKVKLAKISKIVFKVVYLKYFVTGRKRKR